MSTDQIRLFLIDGMAVIYRAHFAMIRNPMMTSAGLNVSAVVGYMNTLLTVIETWKPTHLAVAFDAPGKTFRHEAYPEYKAQRQAMPEDLADAIPHVLNVTEAMNIPILRYSGVEADDVIGTLAKSASERGITAYMVTPDKDFAQLVSDTVRIIKPGRDGNRELGVPEILEDWGIERIEQVIDMLGLMGDASDNVPGVPGIGPKTAQKLIAQFGSLEGILANTDKLKGKQKERLEENADLARLSRELVTINTAVELEHGIDDFGRKEPDAEKLSAILSELEMSNLGKRLLGDQFTITAGDKAKPLQTIKDVDHNYQIADDDAKVNALISQLMELGEFCFDIETTDLNPRVAEVVGISFCWEKGKAWYVPFPEEGLLSIMLLDQFRPVFENPNNLKIGHNLKFDISVLRWQNIEVAGPLFDTMLAHYVIDPDAQHGMDYLAQVYLSYDPVKYEDVVGGKESLFSARQVAVSDMAEYCCEDADVTYQLMGLFKPILAEKNGERVAEVECELVPVLVEMEHHGVNLDVAPLNEYAAELEIEIKAIEKQIYELAGADDFNMDSPKQLGELLFDKLQLEKNPKKTKTGQYATNEQILRRLAMEHEIARVILEYREVRKLKNTYIEPLPQAVSPKTGHIHTSFNQAVTTTGRMASSNPNMQNIPIRSARGREIRKAFVPSKPEYKLLSADYSQIELRIIAEFSKSPGLVNAFKSGDDIHTATASLVFGVPSDEVTREMRSKSKMVNYGIAYGISAFGLGQRLNIPRREAASIIEQYFAAFPEIKDYMNRTIQFARENGYVETLLGRRRYLRDINSRNGNVRQGAERNAINAPIQGTSADMIKIAMADIHNAIKEKKLKSRMLLQIHDELLFDLHPDEEEVMIELVRDGMVNAIEMEIPIAVDVGIGDNWLEAH